MESNFYLTEQRTG